jgi:argininosuccinate synthase
MGRAKKVVLAYSGGVDTSVCIPYLKQEYRDWVPQPGWRGVG